MLTRGDVDAMIEEIVDIIETYTARQSSDMVLPYDRRWSERSLKNLEGVDPTLVEIASSALTRSPYDFTVISGLRTQAEQDVFIANGTGSRRSYHLIGRAIDIMPYINGKLVENLDAFRGIAQTFRRVAEEMGEEITSGALDWDWDFYHLQLEPYKHVG